MASMCSVQYKIFRLSFHPASHLKNMDKWPDVQEKRWGRRHAQVSSLVGPRSTRFNQGQGSISMGMIVRMTSSFPRRTTTRKVVSFLIAVLTSVAEEICSPLMEIMTSCSLSPPLQNKQRRIGRDLRNSTREDED